jgi:hypothetical protein
MKTAPDDSSRHPGVLNAIVLIANNEGVLWYKRDAEQNHRRSCPLMTQRILNPLLLGPLA